MARSTRTHLNPTNKSKSPLIPKHLAKEEFARRLYKLMLDRYDSQAEFARASGLPRNAISVYINGKSFPNRESLKALAKALDMDPSVLLPNFTESAIQRDHPEIEFRVSPADPKKAWLRINRLVHTSTATKILALLEADDANKATD